MLEFHKDSPVRPPNWRWERARMLKEGNFRGMRRKEDAYTLTALKFQKMLDRCQTDYDRLLLSEKEPAQYHAYAIRRPSSDERADNVSRWGIEARLLANEPSDKIAAKMGTSPEVVDYYEKVFFNVSDRLGAQDYIMQRVIGPAVYTGITEREYDVLWKVFGYLYGPVELDTLILTASRRTSLASPEAASDQADMDISETLRRKARTCMRTYALNSFTQEGMLNIYLRFLELEQSRDSGSAAKDVFMNTIQVTMSRMPWSNGDGVVRPDTSDSRQLSQPMLLAYDKAGAELRTDELLAVSSGQELANREEIENIKYPEPANAKNQAPAQ